MYIIIVTLNYIYINANKYIINYGKYRILNDLNLIYINYI